MVDAVILKVPAKIHIKCHLYLSAAYLTSLSSGANIVDGNQTASIGAA